MQAMIENQRINEMQKTININEANFETEVLKSNQPVLVEFATGWSLPTIMIGVA